ncbi:kappaPI-actitoxin-Avd3c-like [Hermetia illucens]|uniref:kappaPI-actitoxin-Avd3c-like n=1 Tax=Hermetia illucens TaxID=343691 RepID=UPI0018CC7635|nr:kappaPI-actitoxin-Avd3c-like [Hermetia illucens]
MKIIIFLSLIATVAYVARGSSVTVPDECLEPQFTGLCEALFYRYAYNPENKTCEKFVYGGCDANRNNFVTKEDCERKCLQT